MGCPRSRRRVRLAKNLELCLWRPGTTHNHSPRTCFFSRKHSHFPSQEYFDYHDSFIQIDQRVWEWRGGFASAALSIVNAYFDDNDFDSDESRREFATSALESWAFLYRDISIKDGEVLNFLFLKLQQHRFNFF